MFVFKSVYDTTRIVIKLDGDSAADDVVQGFTQFMLAAGYHPRSVADALYRQFDDFKDSLRSCNEIEWENQK